MQHTLTILMRWPGSENEGGNAIAENELVNAVNHQPADKDKPKKKGFFAKLKAALQDWSTGDQTQQDIDDATP